ncbi:MAG TPA: hypothetical protein VF165_09500 [Nocardioidaceae bacterium]
MSSVQRVAKVLACACLLLAGIPASASAEPVDPYATYDGQSTCASKVLPGTDYLLRFLVRTHPGTSYVSTLRPCSGDSVSEHKDGRALDWGVDAADPAQKAIADGWLDKVFATDSRGNTHALARRMGIMYVIWNDHIYRAYDGFQRQPYEPCRPVTDCSKTLRHRDHVHVSLSRAGAAAQTTFYRARDVASVPVLYPGTRQLDPYSTAEVTLRVPATGRTVTTDFKLTRGVSYRIVADGLVRTGAGSQVADAVCRWTRDGWTPTGMLRVAGTDPWTPACSDGHTYEASFTASTTDFLRLRVAENTPADAEGALTFSILRSDLPARSVVSPRPEGSPEPRPATRAGLRARALASEKVAVRAASARGALTSRALRRGTRYRVVVTGKAASGGTVFDGQCVRYADRLRPRHTLDLTTPEADHLSLYVQGVRVALRVPGASRSCDGSTHRYVGVFEAVVSGRSRVKVWDPFTYADNSGALTVVLRRV